MQNEQKRKASEKTNVPTCQACHKEILNPSAMTAEGQDYLRHFCGEACEIKWKKEQTKQ